MLTHRPSTSQADGQMTRAMRTEPQAGSKVLRIGVVRAGSVVQERMFKTRTTVHIAQDEHSDIVLSGGTDGAPALRFEPDRGGPGYTLACPPNISGRLAMRGQVRDLSSIAEGSVVRDGLARIALTDDVRGKIVLGEETLLFGFVELPPAQAKPQLPISVQSGAANSVDWAFTMLASVSFLMHFGAVGMLYSDWMDPIVSDESAVVSLVEMMAAAPAKLPEFVHVPNSDETKPAEPSSDARATAERPGVRSKTTRAKDGGEPRETPAASRASETDAQEKGLIAELDRINTVTLAVLDPRHPNTVEVMTSPMPTHDLDEIAKRAGSVRDGTGMGLNLDFTSGAPIDPAKDPRQGLASLGNTAGERASVGERTRVDGPKPIGIAAVSKPQTSGAEIPGAEAVVAGMQASFRRCYEIGLATNPEMSGGVRVTASVGTNGEVRNVSASPSGSVSSTVAQCIAGRVRGAQFEAPKGGAATLIIPVALLQQQRK